MDRSFSIDFQAKKIHNERILIERSRKLVNQYNATGNIELYISVDIKISIFELISSLGKFNE